LRVMKGHRVIIEALAQLAGREVRPRVAFVGRGAMEPALREAVARVGLERQVTFAGFVDDGPAAMAALDVGMPRKRKFPEPLWQQFRAQLCATLPEP
jgi:glycosyltransferase involved in cell wall biosynthesis